MNLDSLLRDLERRNPDQPEFVQAVREVAPDLAAVVATRPELEREAIVERLLEPDRWVGFRVAWEADDGSVQVNRAWRVQHSNAIGPYKGGMRFHPSVDLGVVKFLAFEQTLKNALTGFPMGGAKGGSDFDPKGKSDREVMRFCQALMRELYRHIGDDVDVPAGDIGVGSREIGYLFGEYKRITNRHHGAMTGKGLDYGGSLIRKEATGFGTVYFMEAMLEARGDALAGKRALVSGSGNVALYCIEKLIERGATVLSASDSSGCLHDPDGFDREKLAHLKTLKELRRERLSAYIDRYPRANFAPGRRPWWIPAELAFPCATENELDLEDAKALVSGGCLAVAEGANMPTHPDALDYLRESKVRVGPGKAANAGGVAVSALEQSQNAIRQVWSEGEVDRRLHEVMREIHDRCLAFAPTDGDFIDYPRGANLAGFDKVSRAMLDQGIS